eukprot:Plantae.Rhodophyta-Hildenbrandia_rubra.ctg9872.p1 GENE.Plantae.Rhodophyta-Hildenbrandia_rubra.ctg9872~~Plantae.Rhodophyta-Hildenbrandia_rubra.ctg9872.p1  ORF type:complete len:483 (+),score=65.13 Plantae.Rhodophyta-Hildenbrandia_rubra.ctg9872:52-1449(+)
MRIKRREERRERGLPLRPKRGSQRSSQKQKRAAGARRVPHIATRFPRPRVASSESANLDREAKRLLLSANEAYERGNVANYLYVMGPLMEAALQLTPNTLNHEDTGSDEVDDVDATGEEVEGFTENEVNRRIEASELLDETGLPSVDFLTKKSRSGEGRPVGKLSEKFTNAQLGATVLRSLNSNAFLQLTWRMYESMASQGRKDGAYEVISVLLSVARSRLEMSTSKLYQVRLLYLATCLAGGKYAETVEECRTCLTNNPKDSRLWYLLQYAENRLLQDLRGNALYTAAARQTPTIRFVARLLNKKKDCLPVVFASANRLAARNSHQHAIQKYLMAYSLQRKSSLVCLCIGVQLLFVALSRRTRNRNKTVLQAFAFFEEYRRLRGSESSSKILEVEYNVGRAAQQVGLMHIATEMYQRVLHSHDDIVVPARLNIRRDAAFNLSLIYNNSGSKELAAALVKRYLVF